ncbi:hypothetical protein DFH06DRAFT_1151672 [Mycena polygramma]|nr:hypothetical protein DFH06DRAFT_1151672 [Mycena polygramma]
MLASILLTAVLVAVANADHRITLRVRMPPGPSASLLIPFLQNNCNFGVGMTLSNFPHNGVDYTGPAIPDIPAHSSHDIIVPTRHVYIRGAKMIVSGEWTFDSANIGGQNDYDISNIQGYSVRVFRGDLHQRQLPLQPGLPPGRHLGDVRRHWPGRSGVPRLWKLGIYCRILPLSKFLQVCARKMLEKEIQPGKSDAKLRRHQATPDLQSVVLIAGGAIGAVCHVYCLLLPTIPPHPDSPTHFMESPFREHFNTNYVPSDSEIERIRAYLVAHEAELARLDSLIHELAFRREQVKNHIQSHKALISHPRRLPQDIVEQVFLACLPTLHNAVMSRREPPLLLGRICSAMEIHRIFHAEVRQAAVIDWLLRSAQCPLRLSSTYSSTNHEENQAIISCLLRFSERWRTIRFFNLNIADFSAQLGNAEAPLLVDIDLQFGPHGGYYGDVMDCPLLWDRPSKHVSITSSVLYAFMPPSGPFEWDHLTELTLLSPDDSFGLPLPILSQILKGCTRLVSLCFHFDGSGPHALPTEALFHPSLESFFISRFTIVSVRTLVDLADHLEMPRLMRLRVCNTVSAFVAIGMSDIGVLGHLAERSPLISELELPLVNFTGPSLVEILRFFTRLKKLDLKCYRSPPGFPADLSEAYPDATTLLTVILANTAAPHPCPLLTELATDGVWFAKDLLVELLHKQSTCAPNLQRLELLFCNRPPDDGIPDVRPFLDRGFEVLLRLPPLAKAKPWAGIEEWRIWTSSIRSAPYKCNTSVIIAEGLGGYRRMIQFNRR